MGLEHFTKYYLPKISSGASVMICTVPLFVLHVLLSPIDLPSLCLTCDKRRPKHLWQLYCLGGTDKRFTEWAKGIVRHKNIGVREHCGHSGFLVS